MNSPAYIDRSQQWNYTKECQVSFINTLYEDLHDIFRSGVVWLPKRYEEGKLSSGCTKDREAGLISMLAHHSTVILIAFLGDVRAGR